MTTVTLPQYTGPYDALLSLIDTKELSISDVALSEVTEQFLTYLDTLEQRDPAAVADFLTVAARLLLLKSSLLLPTFQVVEEEEVSLTDRLKLYERFQAAAQYIAEAWDGAAYLAERPRIMVEPEVQFIWAENITTDSLQSAMARVIASRKPPKPLPKTSIDKTVSLKETISRLRTALKPGSKSSFWAYADKRSKTSVIIHFLALLELTKLGSVVPAQAGHFTDITLEA